MNESQFRTRETKKNGNLALLITVATIGIGMSQV